MRLEIKFRELATLLVAARVSAISLCRRRSKTSRNSLLSMVKQIPFPTPQGVVQSFWAKNFCFLVLVPAGLSRTWTPYLKLGLSIIPHPKEGPSARTVRLSVVPLHPSDRRLARAL